MASLCLANSELHVGVHWRGSPALARALSDASRPPALLYPGPGAIDILRHPPSGPVTLIVVDGTWWQAKKVLREKSGAGGAASLRLHASLAERVPHPAGACAVVRVDPRSAGARAGGAGRRPAAFSRPSRALPRHGRRANWRTRHAIAMRPPATPVARGPRRLRRVFPRVCGRARTTSLRVRRGQTHGPTARPSARPAAPTNWCTGWLSA